MYKFICNGSWTWQGKGQGQLIMRSLLRSVHVLIVLIQWLIDNKQSVHVSFYLIEYFNHEHTVEQGQVVVHVFHR
jgi:putative flippase GtrA